MSAFAGFSSPANGHVDLHFLREFNKALRANAAVAKSEGVGTPQQGTGFTAGLNAPAGVSGSIAPLVPQSIQGTLDSATFVAEHLRFWSTLSKVQVTSPLYEAVRVNEHGTMGLDPFIAEGEIGPQSQAEYERQVLKVKYLAEHIEVTDIATMTGIVGANGNVLAQRTLNGTLALLGKLERALFNASESRNSLHFDGMWEQLKNGAPDNYTDAKGKLYTPQDAQKDVGTLYGQGRWATPNMMLVTPRVYMAWQNIAQAHGRYDISGGGSGVTFGAKPLFISGPTGSIPVMPCPLMREPEDPAPSLGTTANLALAIDSSTNVSSGTSYFDTDADAGQYRYKFVAVGDFGTGAVASATVTLAKDEVAQFDFNETAATSIKYIRAYRSEVGGAADTEKYIGDIVLNSTASNGTRWFDRNERRPNTDQGYIIENTPEVMQFVQLADFFRRPLAQTKTTIPFLLMLMGSLWVKVPTKCWRVNNMSFSL